MLLAMNARLTGPSVNWDQLLKLARSSHTKKAWDEILETWGERISHCSIPRPLEEIYSLLKRDPQSLNYNPGLWGSLLRGCLSAWSPQLGHEIHSFARRLHSPLLGIPAAQLYLESGRTNLARETAIRALRLKNLSDCESFQLSLIVATSHAEDGRREKAVRFLDVGADGVAQLPNHGEIKADALSNLGRIQFFLGDYTEAANYYAAAAAIYRNAHNWEAAAKTIFNAAICHLSGDTPNRAEADAFMNQCRHLAETEELPGPLAHCEATLGVDAFQRGAYSDARDHLRLALDYLPNGDFGYRRLRIISTLAETYLAIGRIELATKFGLEALRIAEGDPGGRRHMRHLGLAAELKWEAGQVEESQSLLNRTYQDAMDHGITTLDEISALSRYYLQASMVSTDLPIPRSHPKPTLTRNKHFYLDYTYSLGELAFSSGDLRNARAHFQNCYAVGLEHDLTPYAANGLFGLIKLSLHEHRCSDAASRLVEFSTLISKLGHSPRRSQIAFIEAAIAYQSGHFEQSRKLLRQIQKLSRISHADQ